MDLLTVLPQELEPLKLNSEKSFPKRLFFSLCLIERIKKRETKSASTHPLEFTTVRLNAMYLTVLKNYLSTNSSLLKTALRQIFWSSLLSIRKSRHSTTSVISRIRKGIMKNSSNKRRAPKLLCLFLIQAGLRSSTKIFPKESLNSCFIMSFKWSLTNKILKTTT